MTEISEKRREQLRQARKRYRQTAKGKENQRRYEASPKGLEMYHRYNTSPKGRDRDTTYKIRNGK